MNLYKEIFFPILSSLDPERSHDLTLASLELAQRNSIGNRFLRIISGSIPDRPIKLFGLNFPNEIGVAAGYDKDARVIAGLAMLGFGHIEIGTVTPKKQLGNPKPRVFRLKGDKALINRMGFPNSGADLAQQRLQEIASSERNYIIGASLGKQKETPLEDAAADYESVMRAVFRYTDYLVINVSSPNTPGLRELQNRKYLEKIFITLQSANKELAETWRVAPKPLLVKLSPDLTNSRIESVLDLAINAEISGVIASNTTTSRLLLSSTYKSEQGGVSGAPLKMRSLEIVEYVTMVTKGSLPVIGVGGISSVTDVKDMINAGASLVQIYTGLIYVGPGLVGKILRAL